MLIVWLPSPVQLGKILGKEAVGIRCPFLDELVALKPCGSGIEPNVKCNLTPPSLPQPAKKRQSD